MDQFEKLAADKAKKAAAFARGFRDFAFKGNVVDLAVGVVIGAAFTGMVNSLVKNVMMPLISVVIPGNQSYEGWSFTINGKEVLYGKFLGEVVNFLLVALVIYIFIVKFIGWMTRLRQEEAAAPAPPLTKEEQLLTEIRDLLRENRPIAPTP